MNSFLRALGGACVILLSLPVGLRAEEVSFPAPQDEVAGHPGLTYLDLVKKIVPDLAPADEASTTYEGHELMKLRHIAGSDRQGDSPEKVGLQYLNAIDIKVNGKDRLLLLLDLGQAAVSAEGFAVLALYDLAGTPKLLDAAKVAFDQNTFFRDPAKLAIGNGEDAVITMSTHFNSNQSYVTTALILVRNDRLELVDDIFTFSDATCAFRRTQDIAFEPVGGAIRATVTETITPSEEECDGEERSTPASREIAVTFRWDEEASRYVKDSDAFDRLAEENANRF